MKTTPKKIKASKGGSRTPSKVMGSQGKSVKIPVSHNMKSANKAKKFPC